MSVQPPQTQFNFDMTNLPGNFQESYKMIQTLWSMFSKYKVMPKDFLKFSDEMMEDVYQMAYYLYTNNKPKESLDFFRYLTSLDIKSYKFAFGSAACFHQLKEYKDAVGWYTVAHLNDPTNPLPTYFATQCYMELGQWDAAKFFCEKTIELAQDKPEHASIRDRAIAFKRGIDSKIAA